MFLIVGCQTTQLPEVETKPEEKELVVNVEEQNKQAPNDVLNPFADVEKIPKDMAITSQKPIICGRMDTMLNNVFTRYGEVPVVFGHADNNSITGEMVKSVITMTHNSETGTYSFFEQLPIDERFLCLLSGGEAEIKLRVSGISS